MDIAWLRKETECTSVTTASDTIFTNVVQNLDDNTVCWEGFDKNHPSNVIDWKGEKWNVQISKGKGAHPNSRFTFPAKKLPSYKL